jgi:uncharacterized protein (DUF58 family)
VLDRLLAPLRSRWRQAPGADPEPAALTAAELARRVRRLEITTNRMVEGGVAGGYRSAFHGRGIELAEVRPYQPGDDVRALDWNVTARMGSPFVRQYVHERDLAVVCAVDVSGSLGYGSRGVVKRDLAAEIAVLASFAALANGDRAGAALIGDGLQLYLPPRGRRNQVLRLAAEILRAPAGGTTDLEAGLSAVLANLRRRTVLLVISDFVEASCPRALRAAAGRHDVVVIELRDPADDTLPPVAPVTLRDAESGRLAVIAGGSVAGGVAGGRLGSRLGLGRESRLAARHRERRASQRAELRALTRGLRLDHLMLSTDRPYLPELTGFFRRREIRRSSP